MEREKKGLSKRGLSKKGLINKRLTNKGFTLIELIIVIAIMAVLVGLLAPQVTRYVEKSRQATDISNMDSIKNVVETVLADTKARDEVVAAGLTFTISGVKPSETAYTGTYFASELEKILTTWPSPKQTGVSKFKVEIAKTTGIITVSVE